VTYLSLFSYELERFIYNLIVGDTPNISLPNYVASSLIYDISHHNLDYDTRLFSTSLSTTDSFWTNSQILDDTTAYYHQWSSCAIKSLQAHLTTRWHRNTERTVEVKPSLLFQLSRSRMCNAQHTYLDDVFFNGAYWNRCEEGWGATSPFIAIITSKYHRILESLSLEVTTLPVKLHVV